MVALRKAGLNNKKQRGESHLVSCFISTSNALAMEHPGYHDMKGWGEDKPSHDWTSSQQYTETLRSCHTSIVERGLFLKMVTTHHATSMSSQGGGGSSVRISSSPPKSAVVYFFL